MDMKGPSMRFLKFLLVFLILASLPLTGFSQDAVMVLQPSELGKHQRPPIEFQHEKHAEKIDCLQCHHDYDAHFNNRGGEGQACGSCHLPSAMNGMVSLRDAYHLQCKGCHEKHRSQGKNSGPVTCGGCHVIK